MGDARVLLTPLGGVGRFGKNCLSIVDEQTDRSLVVDCGVRFCNDEAPGFDFGLPDLDALAELGSGLMGYVITHGHEDHIGALPYAVERQPAPIFATPFTARVIARRFESTGRDLDDLHVVEVGSRHRFDPFGVEWVAVNHSIPDATSVAIDTPAGRIVHSGDFRIDRDPVLGAPTDMERLSALGDDGVRLLLADSTGAFSPGAHAGEKSVLGPLEEAFADAAGRVIVVTYGSHVQRLAAVAEVCRKTGRKLAVTGRSLKTSLRAASELGLLSIGDIFVPEGRMRSVHPHSLCVLATGCQAEPRSAIGRIAARTHNTVAVDPGDTVVFSARVIPGHERRVASLSDALVAQGARVLNGRDGRHVSGHGPREDLIELLVAARPELFVAIHGGSAQLAAHRGLLEEAGFDPARARVLTDGDTLVLSADDDRLRPAPARTDDGAWRPFALDGETLVQDGSICAPTAAASIAGARRRMQHGGTLAVAITDDGVRFRPRGLAPGADRALEKARRAAEHAVLALDDDESADATLDDAIVDAVVRAFDHARVTFPEVVVVDVRAPG